MKKKKPIAVFTSIAVTAVSIISLCGTTFAAGRVLSNGKSGDDVYSLQQLLAAYGYFYQEPTGYFGEVTQSALMAFQADYGLEADGMAGPATRSYLGLVSNEEYSYDYYEDSSLSRPLSNGVSGADVYTLQQLLMDYGYFYDLPTGYYGDLTEAAVLAFQSDYGLETDGMAGPATIAALTGDYSGYGSAEVSYFDYGAAVLDAVSWTPATSSGYCAAWVTQVLQNAGVLTYDITSLRPTYYCYAATSGLSYSGSTGFNANDYWAYVCYSDDYNDLAPGMVIATRSSYSYLGSQYGHVGIYMGDGQVVSSVGYKEVLSLDEWISRYNNVGAGSTVAWGYVPY